MAGRGVELSEFYEAVLSDRLTEATTFLHDHIQESVAILYPPSSSPGDPPHRRTGKLYRGIKAKPVERRGLELVGAVGVSIAEVPYAGELEFGLGKKKPRPYLRPGLANSAFTIRQIMTEP